MNPEPTAIGSRGHVLGFLDSLYASAVAFSFALIVRDVLGLVGKMTDHPLDALREGTFQLGPTALAVFFVVDDWIKARSILGRCGYSPGNLHSSLRLWLDVGIALVSFVLLLVSVRLYYFSLYLALFSAICWMGAFWAHLIRKEHGKEEREAEFIWSSHWVMGVVFGLLALVFFLIDRKLLPEARESVRTVMRLVALVGVSAAFAIYKISFYRFSKKIQLETQGGGR